MPHPFDLARDYKRDPARWLGAAFEATTLEERVGEHVQLRRIERKLDDLVRLLDPDAIRIYRALPAELEGGPASS